MNQRLFTLKSLTAVLLIAFLAACQTAPRPPVVDTEHTLSVSVEGTGTGTVTSQPDGIAVTSGDDPATFDFTAGTTVTLTATPDEDFVFVGWSGACSGTDPCAVVMDADKSVTATFAPEADVTERTLSVAVTGGGTGTVTSEPEGIAVTTGDDPATFDFDADSAVILTATAADGSEFTGWTGACTGNETCTVTMDDDKSVTATFALIGDETQNALTVAVGGAGTGSVTSEPEGVDVTSGDDPASFDFTADIAVTLIATPDEGSVFTGWSGACTGDTCVVIMDDDKSVTANFGLVDAEDYTLTVNKIGSGIGTVTSDPAGIDMTTAMTTGSALFDAGSDVVLTATPADGSGFAGWSGGGCTGTGSTCTVTLDANTTVTASFFLPGGDTVTSTFAIIDGNDDAQEYREAVSGTYPVGSVDTTSTDIDLTFDVAFKPGTTVVRGDTIVGLRFQNVSIPQGAVITSASITFRRTTGTLPTGAGTVTLTFHGQDLANAPAFVDAEDGGPLLGISGRATTDASVNWTSTALWGPTAATPNLASIVQEIIDRGDWESGNALGFTITSSNSDADNYRRARSFEAGADAAPRLSITYIQPQVD
jgi:uncharacterized repeat protein (TIGR02543 family)